MPHRLRKLSAYVGDSQFKLAGHLLTIALIFLSGGSPARAAAPNAASIQLGTAVSWMTSSNRTYQPQWAPPASGSWNALGNPMSGDGTMQSLYDPTPGPRSYQVQEMVAGVAGSAAIPANGGFELGSSGIASNWITDTAAGGPVFAVRTNDMPRSGSSNYHVHLASTGGGPVVQFTQSNIPVTGGTTYPFTFYANALTGSSSYNAQWRISFNTGGGDSGYTTFTPGNNAYAATTKNVTAPATATSATIYFHFAGAAITNVTADILIDDVSLVTNVGSGTPGTTNVVSASTQTAVNITSPTTSGTQYYFQTATNLSGGSWTTNLAFAGDGNPKSFIVPLTNQMAFFRLYTPPIVVLPPANLHTISAGITNAIGLAWNSSLTPGVSGYRVFYGVDSGSMTNTIDVGNVTSIVIPNLTPGQTYSLGVITLSPSGNSLVTDATITAQPDTSVGIAPLFDASTALQPETTVVTSNSVITYLADRARDRHARESEFGIYDHYLSWYWEDRTISITIEDQVAKGGSNLTFTYQTLTALGAPEFRVFYLGNTTKAQYFGNYSAPLIGSNLYSVNLTQNILLNRPLQIGDKIEVEISEFLLAPAHGRDNYYGTVMLYVIGQGIVPWQEGNSNAPAGVNAALDSVPMSTNGWLGGRTTLPYQYSNEPTNHFKELAGNIAPTNAQPFMLGRRLHHTDFGDGSHLEPDNPIFTEQIGKLGPKFVNRSCVACHVNNGRALPPAIGQPMLQSVVHVASDASGTPDPVLGSYLQPQSVSGSAEGGVTISGYTTTSGQYGDGTPYSLQKPNYTFTGVTPAFYSVRLAPQLVGMGLLEAVDESTVQAFADPSDSDHDGISGHVQAVTDPQTGQRRLGRFSYKAFRARVSHQIAGAFNSDMGVSSSIFPRLDGNTTNTPVEIADSDVDLLTHYISLLGVSARRSLTDAQALHGEQLFASANCVKCHVPTMQTSAHHPFTELRNQTIHPYTDLLLHDMGPGLADNLGEGTATGAQWRTSPLWSVGLTADICGGEAYLHDGRARTLEEAILWHDGEGAASKEAFRTMSAADRAALIAFLKSL